jgi:hypothetical protein
MARGYAVKSLDSNTSATRKEATLHRLARLDRKIGVAASTSLF